MPHTLWRGSSSPLTAQTRVCLGRFEKKGIGWTASRVAVDVLKRSHALEGVEEEPGARRAARRSSSGSAVQSQAPAFCARILVRTRAETSGAE